MFKRSYWEIAQYKQDCAKTVEEAVKQAEITCGKCNKQCICNEDICPFMKYHKTKLLLLEAEATSSKFGYSKPWQPKKYKKSSKEVLIRKQLLRYFHKLYGMCTKRRVELILDHAYVYIELLEFDQAIIVLRKAGMNKISKQVQEIIEKQEAK